jgi:hypothetical protein
MSDLVESECYYSPNSVCTQTHRSTSSVIIPDVETPADPSLQAAFAEIVRHTSDLVESECYYYSSAPLQDSGSPSVSKLLLKQELDTADSSTNNPLCSFIVQTPLITSSDTIDKPLFTTPHSRYPDLLMPTSTAHSPPDATRLLSTDSRTMQQSDHLLAKSTEATLPILVKCTHHPHFISHPSYPTSSHPSIIIPQFHSPCTDKSLPHYSTTTQNNCHFVISVPRHIIASAQYHIGTSSASAFCSVIKYSYSHWHQYFVSSALAHCNCCHSVHSHRHFVPLALAFINVGTLSLSSALRSIGIGILKPSLALAEYPLSPVFHQQMKALAATHTPPFILTDSHITIAEAPHSYPFFSYPPPPSPTSVYQYLASS